MSSKYSVLIPAIIKFKKAYGLQFHPEKVTQMAKELVKSLINSGFK